MRYLPIIMIVFSILILNGCSAVRLTPSAAQHVKDNTKMKDIYEKSKVVEKELVEAVNARGASLTTTYSEDQLEEAVNKNKGSAEIYSLNKRLEIARSDVRQLANILEGDYSYFVEGRLFFSIEPAIAIRPGFKTKAIPAIGVNYRPIDAGAPGSAMALQAILGGALNPSNESDVGGALGVGLSYPVADSGSISAGYVWFGEDDGEEGAPYVSVTLGNTGTSVK